MNPGRELDALMAEKVMGWKVSRDIPGAWDMDELRSTKNWHPSTDIADAMTIADKLSSESLPETERFMLNLTLADGQAFAEFERRVYQGEPDTFVSTWVETPAHAICLAALKAKGHT